MQDVHVHFLHGNAGGYTLDFFMGFIHVAQKAGLNEIYLLEHTHQFNEFEKVYEPIKAYNDFQRKMYAENNGGLQLNCVANLELGLHKKLLSAFKENDVRILTASDAHKQSDVGANISELEKMLK